MVTSTTVPSPTSSSRFMGQLSISNDDDEDDEEEGGKKLFASISSPGGNGRAVSDTIAAVCSNVFGGLTGITAWIGALHIGQLE